MPLLPSAPRALYRTCLLIALPSLLWAGCLKTLDESLLDADDDGGLGGAGGSAASGGSSGGGGGGQGGSGGTGGDAAADAPADAPQPKFNEYDPAKHPVTNLANGPPPQIIASDDTSVFRTAFDAVGAQLSSHPIAGGSGALVVGGLARPQAMVAPIGSLFIYLAAGHDTTDEGSILRVAKTGGPVANIQPPQAIERAVGIYASADGFAYVSAKAITKNAIALLRFSLSGGTTSADALYSSTDGNESGGDVVVSSSCVYWISNGGIWVVPATGGSRSPALQSQVADAVGITADAANFYYTRLNGEVWQRQLSTAGCSGGGGAEQRIASGFVGIGDVITYDGTVAWTATGDTANGNDGGGVFTTPAGGIDITQIAPATDGPVDIDQSPDDVIYATGGGSIRKVPKQPLGDN